MPLRATVILTAADPKREINVFNFLKKKTVATESTTDFPGSYYVHPSYDNLGVEPLTADEQFESDEDDFFDQDIKSSPYGLEVTVLDGDSGDEIITQYFDGPLGLADAIEDYAPAYSGYNHLVLDVKRVNPEV